MLAAITSKLATMQITKDQTATTPTPTYTAVKASGDLDTLSSAGSVVSTVSTADARANGVPEASPAKPARERDSSWLELEVCREFARQNCPRTAEECKFAHPDPSMVVKDGVVTCCYDFLKDRCQRQSCKYFHPPTNIKQRLVTAGKQFGTMMSNAYMVPAGSYPGPMPTTLPPTSAAPSPILIGGPMIPCPSPPGFVPAAVLNPFGVMTDRLYICPEFLVGRCTVQMCPLVHPEPCVRQNLDSTVTLCRDFARGGCLREYCRYFHPPPHIVAQLAAASMTGFSQGVFMAPPPMFPPYYSPMMFQAPCGMASSQPIPTSVVPVFQAAPAGAVPLPLSVPPGVPLSHAGPIPGTMMPVSFMSGVSVVPPRVETPPLPISVISGQATLLEAPSAISPLPLTLHQQGQFQTRTLWMPTVQSAQQ